MVTIQGVMIIDPEDIANESEFVSPQGWDQEGNNSILNFTLPNNTQPLLLMRANKHRKKLTVVNTGTVLTQIYRRARDGTVELLDVVANGGSVEFETIVRGEIVQCQNGVELHQYLQQCEFMGDLVMINTTGAGSPIIEVFESI